MMHACVRESEWASWDLSKYQFLLLRLFFFDHFFTCEQLSCFGFFLFFFNASYRFWQYNQIYLSISHKLFPKILTVKINNSLKNSDVFKFTDLLYNRIFRLCAKHSMKFLSNDQRCCRPERKVFFFLNLNFSLQIQSNS